MGNKVSILIPIYGVDKYIERCARSLFEQTYENIEYVFVNDCTKDRSIDILLSILKDYPYRKEQVKLIHHEKNRGLAAARNTALDASSGDYLWHVDSDDWIELNAVEMLIEKAEQEKTDILIFDNYNVRTKSIEISHSNYRNKELYISQILLHTIPGSVWNKFFNADFYKKTGVRSIEGLNHGEDYVIIPRLLHKAQRIAILEEPLYYYNLTNQGSYTRNINLKSINNIHLAYRINLDYFLTAEDHSEYKVVIGKLPIRSMLALIKTANKDNYNDIMSLYPECFEYDMTNLSWIDKAILLLLKLRLNALLAVLIKIYRHL